MSSNNFLTVKTQLSEFKTNSDKDTLSEASESGTSNSVTSAEDLQKLAVILGLNSAEDVYQERFRVDRRRLEAMLAENLEESQTAQAFFHRVMNDTNTLVNWPARLKIGARSKKDPHVRVAGRPDDVKLARDKIMQLLDTRSNRVTMKIDVSYTDHSHIIGKGGLTIKRVMEETGCHIHFPDSNRTSSVEKSNQVSIAGDMERVERARARVRALTPLIFCFELPVVPASQPLPDITSPYVQQIQDQYNVQVMLRNRPKLHANLVVVKGVQWEVAGTMEATALLMNYMCGHLANQTQVQMTVEISPMHHSVVVGRSSEQLKAIVKGTGAQVMFPDSSDPNTPAIKKSCVTISGHIKDVYAARQQLMGCLPVVVIFDVSDTAYHIENEAVTKLMNKHNVYINLRRKPKQGITSVVIRGIERCAGDIYEARRELLNGTEPGIAAEIPESYNIPSMGPNIAYNMFNPFSPSHNMNNSPCSPYNMPMDLGYNMGSPLFAPQGGFPPLSPCTLTPPLFGNQWVMPSRPAQYNQSWSPMTNGANMGGLQTNSMQQPAMMQQSYPQMQAETKPALRGLNSSVSLSAASSGYHSNFTGSTASLDTHNTSLTGDVSNVGSPSVSPISKTLSPAQSSDANRSQQELANIISDLPLSERRAPGCEKKTLETLNKMSPLHDYKNMKQEATKAMRETVGSGFRVPTPRWAGYYFSQTSPAPINLNETDAATTPPKTGWNRSPLVRPNIVESAPTPPTPPSPRCRYQQLADLLADTGLGKYIEMFKRHELDLSTFASLNEADLNEIGVTAFGARRKMLLVIAELQKQSGPKGVAGGERKLVLNSPQYTRADRQTAW